MDWLYILMPIAGVKIFWPGLIILGIGVGVIGGFFGMGGAWMVTPGLNILGFPMAFAIGTDIAHMAGKSLISTMRHGKFGNVDYKLGCIMLIGTVVGFEIGAQMIMWLERIGHRRPGGPVDVPGPAGADRLDGLPRRRRQAPQGARGRRGRQGSRQTRHRHRMAQDLSQDQDPADGAPQGRGHLLARPGCPSRSRFSPGGSPASSASAAA